MNNVLNLLSENKSALVFFSPEESFHKIRNAEDLSALLAKCGERALMIFEEKLALSKLLGRCRAQLSSEEEKKLRSAAKRFGSEGKLVNF